MSNDAASRRLVLSGGAVFLAGAASAAATGMAINDPDVVRELQAEFAAYDRALGANDVAALNGFFFDSPTTVRFGIGENLYGYAEIRAYRAAVVASGTPPRRTRTVVTAYGRDAGTVATLSSSAPGKLTRTMQTWIRLPQGWRIVAAHVSTIADPS